METSHPSTRAVNSGNENQAVVSVGHLSLWTLGLCGEMLASSDTVAALVNACVFLPGIALVFV